MADNKLTKSAGEHWVCSVLARLGWSPALTRDGIARTDILAVETASGHMVEIQVKAASYARRYSWRVGSKGCDPAHSKQEWYILVGLSQNAWDAALAWVLPRDHMAAATWIRHQEWLTNPDVPRGQRNTPITNARIDAQVLRRYANRWDLLALPTNEVPVMLPPKFRDWSQDSRIGLRADHPWNADLPGWALDPDDPDGQQWGTWLR